MANKRIIELQERTQLDMNDYLIVDSSTSTRKLSMSTLINYMTMTQMIFVTELPTEDISTSTIYLVPHSGSNTQWDEYIYRENAWVLIGTSTIDLSAIYQTKTDNNLQTTSKQIVGAINEVNNETSNRLDWEVIGTSTPAGTWAWFDVMSYNDIECQIVDSNDIYHVIVLSGTKFPSTLSVRDLSDGTFTIHVSKDGIALDSSNNAVAMAIIARK